MYSGRQLFYNPGITEKQMDIVLSIDDQNGAIAVDGQPVKTIEEGLKLVVGKAQEVLAQNPASEESAMMESFPAPKGDEAEQPQQMMAGM